MMKEPDKTLLKTLQEEADKCILCGSCHAVCPVYAETRDEKQVARGRMALLKAVLSDDLDLSDTLSQALATCIGCKACSANCPTGTAAELATLSAKLTLGREKGLPFYQRLLSRQVFSKQNILSASARVLDVMGRKIYSPLARLSFLHQALPYVRNGTPREIPAMGAQPFHRRPRQDQVEGELRGRVALFYGCVVDQVYPSWAETAIRILNQAGYAVTVPEDLTCCGAPVLAMGDSAGAHKMMETNIDALMRDDLDAVITLCATCGSTLRDLYPKLIDRGDAGALAEKLMDFQEFLVSRGLLHTLKFGESDRPALRVTYHDPCHLNRGMGIREDPRKILRNLPGVEFIEMNDPDRCCGGGGLFSLSHYSLSLEIGRHKVERIAATGAEIVATACPSCVLQLTDLLNREGLDIEVVHVCELMERSLAAAMLQGKGAQPVP